jgi:hypothetical protein
MVSELLSARMPLRPASTPRERHARIASAAALVAQPEPEPRPAPKCAEAEEAWG